MTNRPAKKSEYIDIYDFDKTIYNGDASLDFYLYCVKRKTTLIVYLPYQFWHLFMFILKFENRTAFKEHFFVFLTKLDDAQLFVDNFWEKNRKKIKGWYESSSHKHDVIISASPDFLLRPITGKLKVKRLIATKMDPTNGKIDGLNCRGEEKVKRLNAEFTKPIVRKVFSDSKSDTSILSLASEAYVVKGNKITLQRKV